ncbi:hypothetical protein KY290_028761 [Solanum tuberosum]|uniref:Uncharacterized protein n=1 Tax=Solanum tuberosum TaxID=4113 RepID=A0ABQ7UKG4_SOLTU|nr:hypothetical protein KY289_027960 [Solanum tuberosum]KAH0749529.1 hypothetical protein KY290_028761 [Solanum tuberosum]
MATFLCSQQRSEARILASHDDHTIITQTLMTEKIIERPSISSPPPPKPSPNSKQISEVSPHWANNKLAPNKGNSLGRRPKSPPPLPRPAPSTGHLFSS